MKTLKSKIEALLKKAPVQLGAGYDGDYLYHRRREDPHFKTKRCDSGRSLSGG